MIPQWVLNGILAPSIVALLLGFIAVLRKLNRQIVVQDYKEQHPDKQATEQQSSDRTDELIANLERRIEQQDDEIRDLRSEQRRYQREINEVREALHTAESQLGIARAKIKSLEERSL